MTVKPLLTTDRLTLRLLHPDDAPSVHAFRSDAIVAANTAWVAHQDPAETLDYITSVLQGHSDVDGQVHYVWAICITGRPEVIGTIDFIQHGPQAGHVHFVLSAQRWGEGITPEALREVVAWAFERIPELTEILAGVVSRNARAGRVLEKVGFRRGETRAAPRPPKYPDEVIEATTFHLSREDYVSTGSD